MESTVLKLPKLLHMNDTLTTPPPSLCPLFRQLHLSGFPPFSLAEGQRPNSQSHTRLSVTGQPSLPPLPAARPGDSSIVREGTTERRERAGNGRMKTWKRNVAKDNKRKEWLRRIEKMSAQKKRKIVFKVERRELREREWWWIINEEMRVHNGFPQCSGRSAPLMGTETSTAAQQITSTI